MINQFVFESAPKGFDKGVVVAVRWAAHGNNEPVFGQELAVGCAGELGAAIGVEDKFWSRLTPRKSHAQGGDDQRGVEDLAHGPTDHASSKDIQDGHKIQPALSGEDAS